MKDVNSHCSSSTTPTFFSVARNRPIPCITWPSRDMIETANQLMVSLHQFSRLADLLDALRRDAEDRQDYGEFAHLSQSYLNRMHELNDEIRAYLAQQPEVAEVSGSIRA